MSTAGNQKLVRTTNQKLILDLIKARGLISRADIAKILNLSPPSTSSNISVLLEKEIIREVGEGVSSGGRKPILLELNKEYGYVIGINMGSENIMVSVGNICGRIIDSQYFTLLDKNDGIRMLISIISSIKTLMGRNGIEKQKIKVITIGVPGVYDNSPDKNEAPGIYNWSDIDLIGALKTEYDAEVITKSDASAAALGEYIFGLKKNCSNMLYINADAGIGAGIILNGGLYEGSFGAAGLIRSMAYSKEHIGGIYKKNGYLGTVVSVDKLIQKIKNMSIKDKQIIELCGGDINRLDFGTLKRGYERNLSIIKSELDRVVDLIAISIGNINTVLNVDTIILGGRMAALGEYFILSVKRVVSELCPFTPYITNSVLKDNSVIYGLMAIGQEHILKSIR